MSALPRSAESSVHLGQQAARMLCAVTVLLLLYASFYPFQFDSQRFSRAIAGPLRWLLPWSQTSQADIIANLLGYLPLGFFLVLALPRTWGLARSLVVTTAVSGLFSFAVEIAQNYTAGRHPSSLDVVLNTISGAGGAVIGSWMRGHSVRALSSASRLSRARPVLVILLLLWTALHAAPFVPSLGFYKFRAATEPVRHLMFTIDGASRAFAGWVICAEALRALVRPQWFFRILALAGVFLLSLRVTVAGQRLTLDELIGLTLALVLVLMRPLRTNLVFVVAALLVSGLAPFQTLPAGEANRFEWMPFRGFLEANRTIYLVVIEKAFLYTGATWLAVEAGIGILGSGLILALVLGGIEVAQRYLPGRTPEIADPLMALMAAGLLWALRSRR